MRNDDVLICIQVHITGHCDLPAIAQAHGDIARHVCDQVSVNCDRSARR